MYQWKLEDLKLEDKYRFDDFDQIVKETSEKDKIEFVDFMNNGALTYILNLSNKFNKKRIKKYDYKWLRKNDTRKLVDDYCYGDIDFLGTYRNIMNLRRKRFGLGYDSFVDECFYNQLRNCSIMEHRYLKTLNEYELMKVNIKRKSKKYGTTFGVRMSFYSNRRICVIHNFEEEKEITKEECKYLLDQYEKLENLIKDCSDNCPFRYKYYY